MVLSESAGPALISESIKSGEINIIALKIEELSMKEVKLSISIFLT